MILRDACKPVLTKILFYTYIREFYSRSLTTRLYAFTHDVSNSFCAFWGVYLVSFKGLPYYSLIPHCCISVLWSSGHQGAI